MIGVANLKTDKASSRLSITTPEVAVYRLGSRPNNALRVRVTKATIAAATIVFAFDNCVPVHDTPCFSDDITAALFWEADAPIVARADKKAGESLGPNEGKLCSGGTLVYFNLALVAVGETTVPALPFS